MRTVLMLALLTSLVAVPVWAKTYSCRDSSGKLYYSDNLQGLPEECLGQEKVVKPSEPDNLNYVPDVKVPQGSDRKFEHSVKSAEWEQEQKKLQGQQFRNRAEVLRQRFEQALAEKRRAKFGFNYNKPKHVRLADDQIELVMADKQQLLTELEESSVARDDKDSIRDILAEIEVN